MEIIQLLLVSFCFIAISLVFKTYMYLFSPILIVCNQMKFYTSFSFTSHCFTGFVKPLRTTAVLQSIRVCPCIYLYFCILFYVLSQHMIIFKDIFDRDASSHTISIQFGLFAKIYTYKNTVYKSFVYKKKKQHIFRHLFFIIFFLTWSE